MATPTSAQLDKIADCIVILRDRKTTRLKRPVTLQTFAFENAMDPIASDTNLKDVGFGIIDFTGNKTSPNIRLVNGGEPFRIGSTAKIAMMLAAVQLRTDVRNILGLSPQIVTTPAEFDALYANATLWTKGKAPASNKGNRIAGGSTADLEDLRLHEEPGELRRPRPRHATPSRESQQGGRQARGSRAGLECRSAALVRGALLVDRPDVRQRGGHDLRRRDRGADT